MTEGDLIKGSTVGGRSRFGDGVRGRAAAVLIAACGMCALAPGAAVGGTLDQQQPVIDGLQFAHGFQSLAQTVTPGLSGGIDQVDLMLRYGANAPTAPLSVEIRNVSAGSPGATVLASGSVPAAAVTATPTFLPITFATPAPVTAGTQFAIVAYSSTPNTNPFAWAKTDLAPYAGGSPFYAASSPPAGAWSPVVGQDLTFKTYVAVPPTGRRAAALKKCKKKKSKKARKKCKRKARKLPL